MMNLISLHNSIHNRGHLNVCNRRNTKWCSFGDKMEGFRGEGGILPSLRLPYSWYVTQWWPHGRKTYACSRRVYISLAYTLLSDIKTCHKRRNGNTQCPQHAMWSWQASHKPPNINTGLSPWTLVLGRLCLVAPLPSWKPLDWHRMARLQVRSAKSANWHTGCLEKVVNYQGLCSSHSSEPADWPTTIYTQVDDI